MTTVDWSVLEIEGVMEVAERAARKVARQYESTTDPEDMMQEAVIILATRHQRVRDCSAGLGRLSLGTLFHELSQDLVDKIKTDASRRTRQVSHEVVVERLTAVDL